MGLCPERKSTRTIKEILRLHFEQKVGQRQIARSVNVSQSTVHEYLVAWRASASLRIDHPRFSCYSDQSRSQSESQRRFCSDLADRLLKIADRFQRDRFRKNP